MIFLVSLIPYIYAWLSFCECQQLDPDCPTGYHPEICNPDGKGYTRYGCWGKDHYVWKGSSWNVTCSKTEICKCSIDMRNDDPDQLCKCANPTNPPAFPVTGVIRYNGTNDNGWKKENIKGEVHKDSYGNYLSIANWGYGDFLEIVMLNADGKTFTQYTYADYDDTNNKKCQKVEVSSENYLDSIWREKNGHSLFEQKQNGRDRVIQTWKKDVQGDDFRDHRIMTVEYNTKKEYAVPVSSSHHYYDLKGDEEKVNLDYTYEPIGDASTFRLEDYCANHGDLES